MTWAKYGTEFFDQLAEYDLPADMDDVCQLTHTQVLHYLYSTEDQSATFLKKNLRRIASSAKAEAAGKILASFGIWKDHGNKYEVIHHAEVFRQSLGFQVGKREADKTRKRNQRMRDKGIDPKAEDVTKELTEDVTRDVPEVQTDRQTGIYNEVPFSEDFNKETGEVFDPPEIPSTSQTSPSHPWANLPMKDQSNNQSAANVMDEFMNTDFGEAS